MVKRPKGARNPTSRPCIRRRARGEAGGGSGGDRPGAARLKLVCVTATGPLRDPAHRVSPKAVRLWLMEALIAFVLLVGGSFLAGRWVGGSGWPWVPDWFAARPWLLPVAVGVLTTPFLLAEPFVRYAVHRWELSGDVVYARTGFLTREWVFVPVSRIQTVDKAQGWLERALGLATLEIRTASHAGSSTIKGLDYAVAAGLAERLANRAEQLRDDAT
ncbi:PH domain-containing protein [Nonomuraea sp. SMC257]|uniref:PH domain-containing protein n=1 Tax=Nonomuraea montanisoli TaxID=2741721 RepID=A0A7Y6I373_9ACTN|nr:PH domain-containing protein [Nonomuraea montanisoli]